VNGVGDGHVHGPGGWQTYDQPQQQGQQTGVVAPAAVAAAVAPPPAAEAERRIVGAPVTTPGAVKTKAGRRGALGPLLNRLRAEAAAAAGIGPVLH
jgi:hypothetical protein